MRRLIRRSRLGRHVTPARTFMVYLAVSSVALAAGIVSNAPAGQGCVSADALNPFTAGNYCWYLDVEVTNSSGSDVTDFMARGEVNSAGIISNNILDPLAWTIYSQTGSFQNGQNVEAQDLSETDSQWWFQIGDIPDGESRSVRVYMKNQYQQRDAGVTFTGRELLTIPHDTLVGLPDQRGFSLTITNNDETARDEAIADKIRTDVQYGGWIVFFDDDGGGNLQLNLITTGNNFNSGGLCSIAWNTAWTGERITIGVIAHKNGGGTNDIRMVVDAATGATFCQDDPHTTITDPLNTTPDLLIGDTDGGVNATFNGLGPLTGAVIHNMAFYDNVQFGDWVSPNNIGDNSDRTTLWLLDPLEMTESTSVDPTYTGTLVESLGSSTVDAAYTFNRGQSGFTVDTGIPALVSGALPAGLPSEIVDVAGSPLDSEIFDTDENVNLPFWSWWDTRVDGLRMGREAAWALYLLLPALICGSLAYALFPNGLSYITGVGLPYALAVSNGLISEWWILVWGLAVLSVVGWQQWQRQS